jgi:Domain of unknown function (DUF4331)
LEIPVSELGGDQQVVGVYATTSRKQVRVLREDGDLSFGRWVQVARQGNPLFNEGFVAVADKDLTAALAQRRTMCCFVSTQKILSLRH